MAKNVVQTTTILESVSGKELRPLVSTVAANPSPGNLAARPPDVTRLIGVDYQTSSFTWPSTQLGIQYYQITMPTVSFNGLTTANQRYFNSAPIPGQTVSLGTILNIQSNPLTTGQSTQLLLLCNVQIINPFTTLVVSQTSLLTSAFSAANGVIQGPWFGAGASYTNFSCTPQALVYNTLGAAANQLVLNMGISAQLYMIFTS